MRKNAYFCGNEKINMTNKGKPFIKWVGGKTQLIESIEKALFTSIPNAKLAS
jgi:hypothetical protein